MQSEADWRIPDPDYDRHPAYGGLFGRPRLADRLTALARLLPHLGAYAAYDLVSRARPNQAGSAAASGSPVLDALSRDGVTALRFTPGEMAAIQAALAPFIAELRHKIRHPVAGGDAPVPVRAGLAALRGNGALSTLHKQFNPYSTENELFIHEDAAPAVFEALRAAMRDHGALDAASRYQRRPLDVTYLKLLINHAEDRWWRAPFADVGLADPPAISMHVDHLWTAKAILYLSPVGAESGPFCYCLGSNHVRIGLLEGAARRANDRVDLSSCTPDSRRLFHALPRRFRRKAKFGNDLEGDHPELARLLASERRFTSADGDLILFDDRGIHRGGMVEAGERCMLQIRLG
ncbi:MAG TPA: hypothetical protein VLE23_07975 [Geminicoccaceae bacterium]|nr:hypothetical protein [Geminicoccaceae bacterium]